MRTGSCRMEGVVGVSGKISERLAGCDVAEAVLAHAAQRGWRPYLLGVARGH